MTTQRASGPDSATPMSTVVSVDVVVWRNYLGPVAVTITVDVGGLVTVTMTVDRLGLIAVAIIA
ncbi:hypothetical protein E4U25_007885 [Claviceps purpurea]|nr:hypothetical protein E4U25_007885 [Claviceps purpurea]